MEKKKILLVDDDIDVTTILQAILKKENYEVITAMNKKDGMKLMRQSKPDLAILDVMMTTPYEGFEMAEELRDDPALQNIPFLILTSIDVLITTKPDVQAMAHEFRKQTGYKELQVLLVKDIVTEKAGIDYLSNDGRSVWFPVDGFISKPVEAKKILPAVKKILEN
jgi:CheY-like chemotaxis protein